MTRQDNAELIRRVYEAFNAGDLATLTEIFREDVSLYQPGTAAVGGEYRGRDAVFGFFGRLAEASGGTFRAEVEQLHTSDRNAVVIHHATASRNGAVLDTRTALVFELADGKVVSMSAVQTDQDAWDAFFSAA